MYYHMDVDFISTMYLMHSTFYFIHKYNRYPTPTVKIEWIFTKKKNLKKMASLRFLQSIDQIKYSNRTYITYITPISLSTNTFKNRFTLRMRKVWQMLQKEKGVKPCIKSLFSLSILFIIMHGLGKVTFHESTLVYNLYPLIALYIEFIHFNYLIIFILKFYLNINSCM